VPGTADTGYAGLSIGGTLIVPPDAPLNHVDFSHHVKSAFGEVDIPIFGPNNALLGLQQLTLSPPTGRWTNTAILAHAQPQFGFTWKRCSPHRATAPGGRSFTLPSLRGSQKGRLTTLFHFAGICLWFDGNLMAANAASIRNPVNGANSPAARSRRVRHDAAMRRISNHRRPNLIVGSILPLPMPPN